MRGGDGGHGVRRRRNAGSVAALSKEADALALLGWHAGHADAFARYASEGLIPARVAVEHRNNYELYAAEGEIEGTLAGRLRHNAQGRRRELPTVGDWVAMQPPKAGSRGLIEAVLPRTSVFSRKVAGREREEQIVAANIDIVFLVAGLDGEFNARRLERYLAMAWESGAMPMVVLSKADASHDLPRAIRDAEQIAVGVSVMTTSVKTGEGIESLRARLSAHKTGALLGSSGVGKSTLINALVGFDRQATQEVRASDKKGRHTTTWRELVLLPGGGLLIDTPGMREIQLLDAEEGVQDTFSDVQALAAGCAFGDCTHGPEPDCAVKRAVAEGKLGAERLASFQKLTAELQHQQRRDDKRAQVAKKAADKSATKALDKHLREKGKR